MGDDKEYLIKLDGDRDDTETTTVEEDSGINIESGTGDLKSNYDEFSAYIPPEVRNQIDKQYERLRYECVSEFTLNLEKNRHYYTLVVTKGMDEIKGMSAEEFAQAVNNIES